MNNATLKMHLLAGDYDGQFAELYSNVDAARTRHTQLADKFTSFFGERDNLKVISAPGRTEVGGNHTDHQHGRVLAGSIDLDIAGIISQNDSRFVKIKSDGYSYFDVINIDSLEYSNKERNRSYSLIKGILYYFKEYGYKIGGFDAFTTNNVIRGSGLSSSAAFEIFICTVLNILYNDGKIPAVELAKISQKAESEFFGKPCGLLDQCSSAFGGFTSIDFKNPAIPITEKIDFDLKGHGYSLCIVNTGGSHAGLTDDYALITAECKEISNYFGKEYLRDVNPDDFFNSIGDLRGNVSDRSIARAIHFFNEDARVEKEKQALLNDNFDEFLRLVNESGNSSFKYLQNVYSISNPAEQGITLGLALSERFIDRIGKGACRVHGGGFAGTVQAYIPTEFVGEYCSEMHKVFGNGSCHILKIRPVGGYELKI